MLRSQIQCALLLVAVLMGELHVVVGQIIDGLDDAAFFGLIAGGLLFTIVMLAACAYFMWSTLNASVPSSSRAGVGAGTANAASRASRNVSQYGEIAVAPANYEELELSHKPRPGASPVSPKSSRRLRRAQTQAEAEHECRIAVRRNRCGPRRLRLRRGQRQTQLRRSSSADKLVEHAVHKC